MKKSNIRKAVICALMAVTAVSLFATEAQPRRRGRPRRPAQETGGLVFGKAEGNYVRFVNAQDKIPARSIQEVADEVQKNLLLPTEVCDGARGENAFAAVKKAAEMKRGGISVLITEAEFDVPVLSAPEAGWAIVNVNALLIDNPDADKAFKRLKKEAWRAFGFACGSGFASMKPCVMQSTRSLRDLDAITYPLPSPMQHNTIIDGAKARGVISVKINTYLGACREGWAPAPTNDVQKAIWEKVKTDKERGPSNPIRILPPKRK